MIECKKCNFRGALLSHGNVVQARYCPMCGVPAVTKTPGVGI